MKQPISTIVAAGLLIGSLAASAETRTWDFTITIDQVLAGTFPVGSVLSGSVSLDDAGVPLEVLVTDAGLITDLSFDFNGFSYDESIANTGSLQLNADGSLHLLRFGTDCFSGACIALPFTESWFVAVGSFREGNESTEHDFEGSTSSGIRVRGDMSFSERVPQNNPGGLLQQLRERVTGVGPGTSLADKVALAQTYFAVPDVQATCASLHPLLKQLSAQRGKKIPADLTDELTADAITTMVLIGCE